MEHKAETAGMQLLELLAHETLLGDGQQAGAAVLPRGRGPGGRREPRRPAAAVPAAAPAGSEPAEDRADPAEGRPAAAHLPGNDLIAAGSAAAHGAGAGHGAGGWARAGTGPETDYARELYTRIQSNFERLRHGEALLLSLFDYIRELSQAGGVDALLTIAARQARRLLLLDAVFVSVPEQPRQYRIVAADGQVSTASVGTRLPGGPHGFGGDASSGPTPVWTPDYLRDCGFEHTEYTDKMITAEGVRGVIAVPLYRDERRFGMLFGASRSVRRFTAAEVSLIEKYAQLVGAFVGTAERLAEGAAAADTAERRRRGADEDLGALHRVIEVCHEMLDEAPSAAVVPSHLFRWAAVLGFELRVYGRDDRMLAATGDAPEDAPGVLPAADAAVARVAADVVELGDGRWLTPLRLGPEHLGTLVCCPGRAPTERDTVLLRLAARVVAACLGLATGREADAGVRRRDALLEHLLFPNTPMLPQAVALRTRELGVELDTAHVVALVRTERRLLPKAVLWAQVYTRRVNGLYLARHDDLVLLVPGRDPAEVAESVREELAALLQTPVTVGAGGPTVGAGESLRAAYAEAGRCLSAMLSLGMIGRSAGPRRLGFLGLLMAGSRDVPDLVGSVVGPVFEYDAQRSGALVETLDAYFESGGNATTAAKALHVHPNTVSRRLERISELLGADWQQPQRMLEIQVALQLVRIRGGLAPDAGQNPPG